MKGSMFGKWMYVACALAGYMTGCLLFTMEDATEIKQNTITKDGTLLQNREDSVLFNVQKKITAAPVPTLEAEKNVVTAEVISAEVIVPEKMPSVTTLPAPTEVPKGLQTKSMPSLASQWIGSRQERLPKSGQVVKQEETVNAKEDSQIETAEVITYPAKILGQTPVLNRSDAYVSYFEFTYDLVTMVESEVKQRGLNMTALMTKFAVKALLCGVDIEKLDINAPIPREKAALTLWLAAGILGEKGSSTSAKEVLYYVTDIEDCSLAEKRAVAYLYEQGIVSGYNKKGQRFYPDDGLKTEEGNTWIYRIKQCWK